MRHSTISNESTSNLSLIGRGKRNVSSFTIDKNSHQLLVQKTWSFFSDKIKILYEFDDNVFLLNSENILCVTNSKNQSVISPLSDLFLNQAVMYSEIGSNYLYLITECQSDLMIFEIYNNEIVEQHRIDCAPVEAPIRLRGNFCIVNTHEQTVLVRFSGSKESPYEIFKITPEFKNVDILDFSEKNGALTILGYKIEESEGQICTFDTLEHSIQRRISFKDSSLAQSNIEFGRYLCFSGIYKN